MTVVAHFEDPGVQQALKQLLGKPENKGMLLMYEASLPSWTVVLAQYSPLYHPWMRHLVKLISFVASCVTMSIGFYDLYMHLPIFRNFLNAHFHSWVRWLEEIIYIRMTILAGYIFYFPF